MENGATDEERAEALQQWWQRWGRLVIVGIVLVVLTIVGTRLWFDHQASQAEAAAALYRARMAADQGDHERAAGLAEWAGERAEPAAVRPAAELRRARLLLELDQAGEAAELAAGVAEAHPAYAGTARAIEGDARAANGELEAALSAYRSARQARDGQGRLLDMKIDDLTSRLAAEES
jgi:predicted negative regulator of RcsB-dependent stress response